MYLHIIFSMRVFPLNSCSDMTRNVWDSKMENTVGRYEHLNRGDESKRGYLFLHPAFPPAGPITMGFGLQSYSPVAPKGTPVASAWQHPGPHACAFSYIVVCRTSDTSPSGLHRACLQIAGWGSQGFFVSPGQGGSPDLQKGGSHLRELLAARDLRAARGVMCCLLGTECRRIITVLSFLITQANMPLKVSF